MRTILLAEDDTAIRDVVTYILEGEGFSVKTASNSEEIFSYLKIERPLLIMVDISLNGSDGGKIAKKLKSDPLTQSIPLIVVSANPSTEEIAKKAGADGFLMKPFEMNDLLTVISSHISS